MVTAEARRIKAIRPLPARSASEGKVSLAGASGWDGPRDSCGAGGERGSPRPQSYALLDTIPPPVRMAHGDRDRVTREAGTAAMKCQKCPNAATLHITEILSENHVEELHLCEGCAHKYLYEPQPKANKPVSPQVEDAEEPAILNRECEVCGTRFVDFRNTGRLGCPHDYDVFRDELFFAALGQGAFRGEEPIRVAATQELSAASVTTDNCYDPVGTRRNLELCLSIEPCPWILMRGSAVLGMCDVACGRTDLYFHTALQPWDNAAAFLIVREAGGHIKALDAPAVDFLASAAIVGNGEDIVLSLPIQPDRDGSGATIVKTVLHGVGDQLVDQQGKGDQSAQIERDVRHFDHADDVGGARCLEDVLDQAFEVGAERPVADCWIVEAAVHAGHGLETSICVFQNGGRGFGSRLHGATLQA